MQFSEPKAFLKRFENLWGWFLGMAFLILYLLLPIRMLSYDAIAYANETVNSIMSFWFHPHHLLYTRTNWLIFAILRLFIPGLSPLTTMAWFDSFLGAGGLCLFYRITKTLSSNTLPAILLTITLGLSQGYYIYSAMGEVVIPVCFFFLLVIYLIISRDKVIESNALVIGLCFGIAMLYHQTVVLYLPILLALLLMKSEPARRLGNAIRFLLGGFGLMVLVYLIVMINLMGFAPNQWWLFISGETKAGYWGHGTIFQLPNGIAYWLNSASHSFILNDPRPSEIPWIIASKVLVWGLVVFALVMAILKAIKRNYLGIVVVINLALLIGIFTWWEYNCWDFWVIPMAVLLLLVAWESKGKLNLYLSIWLLIYIPIVTIFNWQSYLTSITDSEEDLMGRTVKQLNQRYQSQNMLLFLMDGAMAEYTTLMNIPSYLWVQEDNKIDVDLFLTKLLKDESKPKIVLSDDLFNLLKKEESDLIPQFYRINVDKAFANAKLVVDIKNRRKQTSRFWELGDPQIRSRGKASNEVKVTP